MFHHLLRKVINLVVWFSLISPFFLLILYADSTPESVAAEDANAVCIYESVHDVYGYIVLDTSKHPVAVDITTWSSFFTALNTILTIGGTPASYTHSMTCCKS